MRVTEAREELQLLKALSEQPQLLPQPSSDLQEESTYASKEVLFIYDHIIRMQVALERLIQQIDAHPAQREPASVETCELPETAQVIADFARVRELASKYVGIEFIQAPPETKLLVAEQLQKLRFYSHARQAKQEQLRQRSEERPDFVVPGTRQGSSSHHAARGNYLKEKLLLQPLTRFSSFDKFRQYANAAVDRVQRQVELLQRWVEVARTL